MARESEQVSQQRLQTAISMGATLVGALFGRKSMSASIGRATTTARGVGRTMREREDVERGRGERRQRSPVSWTVSSARCATKP